MLVSVVSAIAPIAGRSRMKRPTSSDEKCCASDALPPLPKTRIRPPFVMASRIASAARMVGPRWVRTRWCSAMVPAKIASVIAAASSRLMVAGMLVLPRPIAVGLQVRRELLRRELHRLVDFRRHLDLHRVVLARGMPLPVVRHQDAAQVGMPVEVDPEHVVDFALAPVHRLPHARQRR